MRGPMAAGRPTALFKRTKFPTRSAPSPASHAGYAERGVAAGAGQIARGRRMSSLGARQGAIPRRPAGWWRSSSHSPLRITRGTQGRARKGTHGTQHFPRARGGCVPPRRQGSRTAGVPPPAACSVPQTRRFPWQRPASRLAGPMRHSKRGGTTHPPRAPHAAKSSRVGDAQSHGGRWAGGALWNGGCTRMPAGLPWPRWLGERRAARPRSAARRGRQRLRYRCDLENNSPHPHLCWTRGTAPPAPSLP